MEKTLVLLKAIDPSEVEGVDDKLLTLPTADGGTAETTLLAVTLSYAVPNFFFHVNMAYAILRSKGVPLGKNDYLDAFNHMG